MMHTKEPWAQNGHRIESRDEHGVANDGWIVAQCEGMDAEANTRRIVAAVNACAGITTGEIEMLSGKGGFVPGYARIQTQRDELLAALRPFAEMAKHYPMDRTYGNRPTSGIFYSVASAGEEAHITVEDLHAAASAIARAQGEAK